MKIRNRETDLKNLEFIFINLFIEETKHIFTDPAFQSTLLKISRSERLLRPLTFEMQRFKRYGSQKNLRIK